MMNSLQLFPPILFTVPLVSVLVGLPFGATSAIAQLNLIPDRNPASDLGTQVTPNFLGTDFSITGGTRSVGGGNLFHSFREFNVRSGRTASFQVLPGVQTIFSRVVGTDPSDIFGAIRTVGGTANLFLLNPNGILFGPGSDLNVAGSFRGSFVGSTLDALVWPSSTGGSGNRFSATTPGGRTSVLRLVGDPSGFLTSRSRPAGVEVRNVDLFFEGGQSLLLVGGNVLLNGGELIEAGEGGRVELAGIGGVGTVGLSRQGGIWRLQVPDALAQGDIRLTGESLIDVLGEPGGTVALTGRHLTLEGESRIDAGMIGWADLPGRKAGDVVLRATGDIRLSQLSGVNNTVEEEARGSSGDIVVQGRSLTIEDLSGFLTDTFGQGNAGNVTLTIDGPMVLGGGLGLPALIGARVDAGAVGNGGTVRIQANSLRLSHSSAIATQSAGWGNAGNVEIRLGDRLLLETSGLLGFSGLILSGIEPGSRGNAGTVSIQSREIVMRDGGAIGAATLGRGNGGVVNLQATERIELSGESATLPGLQTTVGSDVGKTGQGRGGTVTLQAPIIQVKDGAQVLATTNGIGTAGQVTLQGDRIEISGTVTDGATPSKILASVEPGAIGNGGTVLIQGKELIVQDGGVVGTSSFGQGNAGQVLIQIDGPVRLSGTSRLGLPTFVGNGVGETAQGNGGSLVIQAQSLEVLNGAWLTAILAGRGQAGRIAIDVSGDVVVSGTSALGIPASILATVGDTGVGNGGAIAIQGRSLSVLVGGIVGSSTGGRGNAGQIQVQVSDQITVAGVSSLTNQGAAIAATVTAGAVGQGGTIDLQGQRVEVQDGGQISVNTSGRGDAGDIRIQGRESVLIRGSALEGLQPSQVGSSVAAGAIGNGGSIAIAAPSIAVLSGGLVGAITSGIGNAGQIRLQGENQVTLGESAGSLLPTFILAGVQPGAVGNGGDIEIQGHRVAIQNGVLLGTTTSGQGNAGNVSIEAGDQLTIQGVGQPLRVSPQLAALLSQAGIPLDPSLLGFQYPNILVSGVDRTGVGQGGVVQLRAGSLTLGDGSIVSTSTQGQGNAGRIEVQVRGDVNLQGRSPTGSTTQILSGAEVGAVGNGGAIAIQANQLNLDDGSRISVSNASSGNAGQLNVSAQRIRLDQQSTLEGTSTSGQGGDLNLKADLLTLRRNSLISAVSGTPGQAGRDGNIQIEAGFIVAVPSEDSDIVATGFGRTPGSNIQIQAQSLLGTQFRNQRTPKSDIVATGQVVLSLEVEDPSRGLVALPVTLVDRSDLIDRFCRDRAFTRNTFVITGRGGMAETLDTPRSFMLDLTPWVEVPVGPAGDGGLLRSEANLRPQPQVSPQARTPDGSAIASGASPSHPSRPTEATAIRHHPNGSVELVASAPTLPPGPLYAIPCATAFSH